MVEAEVRKYASEVALHVSDGPDVVFRYQEKEYAIDVETGSNEARNPLMLKQKFKRYEERYYRSFILVTNKKLKYRYSKYGTVLTRSTFRSVLHDALLSNPDTQYNMELAKRRKNKKSSNEESDDAASD